MMNLFVLSQERPSNLWPNVVMLLTEAPEVGPVDRIQYFYDKVRNLFFSKLLKIRELSCTQQDYYFQSTFAVAGCCGWLLSSYEEPPSVTTRLLAGTQR